MPIAHSLSAFRLISTLHAPKWRSFVSCIYRGATNGATGAVSDSLSAQQQQQQATWQQGKSSSWGNAGGGGSKWARIWPLGAAGVPLLALGLYGSELKEEAKTWSEAGTYHPIPPSHTPDGLKAALAHNERETSKQSRQVVGYLFDLYFAWMVNFEFRIAAGRLEYNNIISRNLLIYQRCWLSNELLSLAEALLAAEDTSPGDRARYRQLHELMRAQPQVTQEQAAALDRARLQMSALLPPHPDGEPYAVITEGSKVAVALKDRKRLCQEALERERRELSVELDRITTASSSGPDEQLLVASRARQRDIKLARNQAMLAAYRKQQEVLEPVLGPRSGPEPDSRRKILQAALKRSWVMRRILNRQREGLVAALAAFPESGGSSGSGGDSGNDSDSEEARVRQRLEELLAAFNDLLGELSFEGTLNLVQYVTTVFAPDYILLGPFLDWTATALLVDTESTIRALEREREELLASGC